jgi:hypothetical protein
MIYFKFIFIKLILIYLIYKNIYIIDSNLEIDIKFDLLNSIFH